MASLARILAGGARSIAAAKRGPKALFRISWRPAAREHQPIEAASHEEKCRVLTLFVGRYGAETGAKRKFFLVADLQCVKIVCMSGPAVLDKDSQTLESRLGWLTEIARSLAGQRDLNSLLDAILSFARQATKADGGAVYR
jgi:hypothetical protein